MTTRLPSSTPIAKPTAREIETAKIILENSGHVVLKEASYRKAQERQRVAEALMGAAQEEAQSSRFWAVNCLTEERRLRDRLNFVYGVARAHGASVAELNGTMEDSSLSEPLRMLWERVGHATGEWKPLPGNDLAYVDAIEEALTEWGKKMVTKLEELDDTIVAVVIDSVLDTDHPNVPDNDDGSDSVDEDTFQKTIDYHNRQMEAAGFPLNPHRNF